MHRNIRTRRFLYLRNALYIIWLYTCHLSRIVRESQACGLKTSISRIKDNSADNFLRLTRKLLVHTWLIIIPFCMKAKWREKSLIQDSSFTWWKFWLTLRLVLCRSRYFICEGKFNWLLYINLFYKVSFPRRPFRRHESRTHCCCLANYQDSGIYSWGMHLIR